MRGHFKPHSEETKKKISEKKKANPIKYWLGKKRSEETKKKISGAKKGIKTGKRRFPMSELHRINLSKALKGRETSLETRIKLSLSQKGEKGSNWRGGIWLKNRKEYMKYVNFRWGIWRKEVFERDKYICQECGDEGRKGAYLEAHHIIPMREIFINKQYNLIYEVSNGLTLCRKCHMKTFKRK